MASVEGFGSVRSATITVLVDNRADLIAKSTDRVTRFTREPLLAEHGFSALVHLAEPDVRILWDAGMSRTALPQNAQRMEIDVVEVDLIALSHGHGDHTGAMTAVIESICARPGPRKWEKQATIQEMREWARGRRVPLVAHPAAFRERWSVRDDGTKYGPSLPPPWRQWEVAGADVTLSAAPHQLAPGCWTTGTVPRQSFETAGRSTTRAYREGDAFIADDLADDQAIVIHVQDLGLVVLAGCAHSGIVNTVNYAREISGVKRVWAILGGFHLAPADDDEIDRTVDAILEMAPEMIAPSHCTGFPAECRFAQRMPDQFVPGAVGTTYRFRSG
jgi:7,8-dihydropterin-6-yl-methyl-4-(beta-D-ribofuranosyl)aminobenzene 5'-phosphate synthase